MQEIYLKLKDAEQPYKRRIGATLIEAAPGETKAFEMAAARIALATGDFELSEPEQAQNRLPDAFPHRDDLFAAGVRSLDELAALDDKTIIGLPKIGTKKLADIRAYAPQPVTGAISLNDGSANAQGDND